jgi:hypothetical protein
MSPVTGHCRGTVVLRRRFLPFNRPCTVSDLLSWSRKRATAVSPFCVAVTTTSSAVCFTSRMRGTAGSGCPWTSLRVRKKIPEKSALVCAREKPVRNNPVTSNFITPRGKSRGTSAILPPSRVQHVKRAAKITPPHNLFYPCKPLIRGQMQLALDIQILHIQRVILNELPSRLHVFTHQRGENGLALRDVFQLH